MRNSSEPQLDVLVVGAGAAGVGVAVALINAGIEHFGVLERKESRSLVCWLAGGDALYHAIFSNQLGRNGRYQCRNSRHVSWI